jgi:hypothetical protein
MMEFVNMFFKSRISVVGTMSIVIIPLILSACGSGSETSSAPCQKKGYTEKVCATSGKDTIDTYEWDGTSLTNHSTEPTMMCSNCWMVEVNNKSSVLIDVCLEGMQDDESDGEESILQHNVGAGVSNEYPKGPPCVYVRLHEE